MGADRKIINDACRLGDWRLKYICVKRIKKKKKIRTSYSLQQEGRVSNV